MMVDEPDSETQTAGAAAAGLEGTSATNDVRHPTPTAQSKKRKSSQREQSTAQKKITKPTSNTAAAASRAAYAASAEYLSKIPNSGKRIRQSARSQTAPAQTQAKKASHRQTQHPAPQTRNNKTAADWVQGDRNGKVTPDDGSTTTTIPSHGPKIYHVLHILRSHSTRSLTLSATFSTLPAANAHATHLWTTHHVAEPWDRPSALMHAGAAPPDVLDPDFVGTGGFYYEGVTGGKLWFKCVDGVFNAVEVVVRGAFVDDVGEGGPIEVEMGRRVSFGEAEAVEEEDGEGGEDVDVDVDGNGDEDEDEETE